MRSAVFIFLISISGCVFGQTELQFWSEIGMEQKFSKKWDASIESNNRFDAFGLRTHFDQLGIRYKFNKRLRASVDYRFVAKRQNNGNFLNESRLNFNVYYRQKLNGFEALTRLRYQQDLEALNFTGYEPEFDRALRLRLQVRYTKSQLPVEPFSSVEFFYRLRNHPLGNRISKMRVNVGASYAPKGPHSFKLAYIYDQSLQLPNDRRLHVISLSYSFALDAYLKSRCKTSKPTPKRNTSVKTLS